MMLLGEINRVMDQLSKTVGSTVTWNKDKGFWYNMPYLTLATFWLKNNSLKI